MGLTGLKWAELELPSENGKGTELTGKRLRKNEWRNLCQHAPRNVIYPEERVVKEKETIIKEIVLIPYTYCGSLMPNTALFCPNCGGRKKA